MLDALRLVRGDDPGARLVEDRIQQLAPLRVERVCTASSSSKSFGSWRSTRQRPEALPHAT